MRKATGNPGKNAKKRRKRKNPKGEDGTSISITPLPAMTVPTTATTPTWSARKGPTRKAAALPTGIMIPLSVSMDMCQGIT